ncbi:Divergent AAA domain protein [Posidoniimonas polymericola]|uniref:Divergent AAA domain protein n=1 Tax=Posidoniimonas polymericola TaxID=2528002 RepID=A0A5C5YKR9_9BACT|nr:ATP-binding protein [Posidoniimonas polymericola]TWT75515.1 Divergent AAA domain protein [Posidoniimonas polymericola]
MSLWSKDINAISFDDVLEFCEAELPEGTELDYKQELTKDIWQVVGAMANTRGGLVIIGVAEEKETATPQLPLCGIALERGIEARIIQLCRDRLSPPVLPEISKPLLLPGAADRCAVVVRVPLSPLAPHASRNRPEIRVRTGSLSNPEELAAVDRIVEMLRTRREWELTRGKLIDVSQHRLSIVVDANEGQEQSSPHTPMLITGYVAPTFSAGPVCDRDTVFRQSAHGSRRRVPGGVLWHYGSKATHFGTWGEVVKAEAMLPSPQVQEPTIYLYWILEFLRELFEASKEFYSNDGVSAAGPLRAGIAFKGCRGFQAKAGRWDAGKPLLDDEFRIDTDLEAHDLLDSEPRTTPMPEYLHGLLGDIAFAWDCGEPPADWAPRW